MNSRQQCCARMQNNRAIHITKADGERELFEPRKLHDSLVRSGASKQNAGVITDRVQSTIREGDKTKDIYTRAFAALRRIERPVAARYSVKRALLELGPSGYPFEDFLAEIYKALGYTTRTRVMVKGKCVEHELDLELKRNDERVGIEAKFHNSHATKSDLKVALYVQSRYEDIAAAAKSKSSSDYTGRMLITNTKFTTQAQAYAACAGLKLVSWDYPAQGNLRQLIEDTRLHPVSCLTTLSRAHKRRLMEQGIVLCRQLKDNLNELAPLGISEHVADRVRREIEDLCKTH